MKKILGVVGLIALLAIGAGVYYVFFPPITGIQTQGTPTAQAEEPPAASEEEPPAPFIEVEPSEDQIDNFPASITVKDGDETFVTHYTGQLRRIKTFAILPIKTYDLASYVVEPKRGNTEELLDDLLVEHSAKVFMLRFLAPLPGRQITNDIYDEINTTFTDVDVQRLKPAIDSFCQQFLRGSSKGDVVYIVWLPGGKIYSCFNDSERVEFVGQDGPFARAVWRIWAGEQFGEIRVGLVSRYADGKTTK